MRYGIALRRLRADALTLGLCLVVLGSAVGMFSGLLVVASTLLRRPIVLMEPERTVRMGGLSDPILMDPLEWWGQARSFELIAKWESAPTEVMIAGQLRVSDVAVVSPGFFSILDGEAVSGRLFVQTDFGPGSTVAAVISDSTWQERFSRSPTAVGARLRVASLDCTVVGIARAEFLFPRGADVWIPRNPTVNAELRKQGRIGRTEGDWLGKLATGSSIEAARHEIQALLVRLNELHGPKTGFHFGTRTRVDLLHVALTRRLRPVVYALLTGAGFVLLLAFASVSTILFTKALQRREEFAIRLSLGASQGGLIKQLAFESAFVGAAGGLAGGVAALWLFFSTRSLHAPLLPLLPENSPLPVEIVWLGAALGTILGLVAGLLPAIFTSLWTDWDVLRRSPSGAPLRWQRLRTAFVFSQIVVAMVLLVGAGVSLRTLGHLSDVNLGFQPEKLIALKFSLPALGDDHMIVTLESLLAQVVAPELAREAAVIDAAPLADQPSLVSLRRSSLSVMSAYFLVHGRYFHTMTIPVVRGRDFHARERDKIIVSEAAAKRFWGDHDPVGDSILLEGETSYRSVVGVVADVHSGALETDPSPQFYLPYSHPYRGASIGNAPFITPGSRVHQPVYC